MKTLKKILIGAGIAIVVGFISLVIYYIYQDSLNEKKLSNEFDEIDSLLTNSDIHNDLIISSHTNIEDLKEFLISKNYKIEKEISVNDKKDYTIIYAKSQD